MHSCSRESRTTLPCRKTVSSGRCDVKNRPLYDILVPPDASERDTVAHVV
jgi:hypothetical protein